MSQQELQDLRRRLEEEQRLREEERRLRDQAEEQLRVQMTQIQETTLPELLDGCHLHLFLGLSIQQDKSSSTKGDPANADRKLRPDKIREWTSFPTEQALIWKGLMGNKLTTERRFTPLLALKEYGKEARQRMVSSELDLGYFQRQTVESRVASIVTQLYANPQLRQIFCLKGDIAFENHANTLTDESNIVADMGSLSLSQRQPRRSDRLAAKSKVGRSAQPPQIGQKNPQTRTSRPRADQFCVYNKGPEEKVPAFIVEYKAPHKVSLAHIRAGLQDMDLDEVLHVQGEETPEDICRRIVAAIITQTFSYMILCGVEFGLACTGEAYIYLRVLDHDPSTVYYYLSVPKEDVGLATGWTGDLDSDNRLHLTAVGQMVAFTLRALREPIRDIAWTNWAADELKTWEMMYDDLLEEIGRRTSLLLTLNHRLEVAWNTPEYLLSRLDPDLPLSRSVTLRWAQGHPVMMTLKMVSILILRVDDLQSPAFLTYRVPRLYRRVRNRTDHAPKASHGSIAPKSAFQAWSKGGS
ncbi:hypothetical protein AtubIFM54640_010722 [Aspergillus tubingensis]|nr:hypothetical protein AtubIFM54640_010722 [Aspergillus tubingensis]